MYVDLYRNISAEYNTKKQREVEIMYHTRGWFLMVLASVLINNIGKIKLKHTAKYW